MKGFITIAVAILVGLVLLSAPASSRATDDVIDCSSGCLIMTCSASGACTIWECNASGCHVVGTFQRLPRYMQKSQVSAVAGPGTEPPAGATVCEFERETCAVKSCADGRCDISIFDGTAFVPAAVVGDISHVVDRAQRELDSQRVER